MLHLLRAFTMCKGSASEIQVFECLLGREIDLHIYLIECSALCTVISLLKRGSGFREVEVTSPRLPTECVVCPRFLCPWLSLQNADSHHTATLTKDMINSCRSSAAFLIWRSFCNQLHICNNL